jgi:hypothetical protein
VEGCPVDRQAAAPVPERPEDQQVRLVVRRPPGEQRPQRGDPEVDPEVDPVDHHERGRRPAEGSDADERHEVDEVDREER